MMPEIDRGSPYLNMVFMSSTILSLSPLGFCNFLYNDNKIKILMRPAISKAIVVPSVAPKVPNPRIIRKGIRKTLRQDWRIIVKLLSPIFSMPIKTD